MMTTAAGGPATGGPATGGPATGATPVIADGLVGKMPTRDDDERDMYIALAFSISFVLLVIIGLCWCYYKHRRQTRHHLIPTPTERSKEIINYFVPSMTTSKVRLTEDLNANTVPWQCSLNNSDCAKDKQHLIEVDSHTDGPILTPSQQSQVRRQSVDWPIRLSQMRRGQCMERYSIHTTQLTRSQYEGLPSSISEDGHSSSASFYSPGRICFSLSYVNEMGILYVVIKCAQHLLVRPRRSHVNPYVKLALLPDKKPRYTTKVHRKSSSPWFDESFIFSVHKEDFESRELKITVKDYERFGRRHAIGHVTFPLEDMKKNMDLDCHEGIWRDLVIDVPSRDYRGEMLVTLMYRPSDSCLDVTIVRGRYLAMPDEKSVAGGVYIQMSLMVSERVWKIKHTRTEDDTANPIFDHEISVQINAFDLEQTNIVLSAYGKTALGACRLIGCVTLGPYKYTSGHGLQHWREMLNCPNMDTSMWHTLS